ncbi:MAG: TIGR02266 family protein [Pseudomonadota bacterium]
MAAKRSKKSKTKDPASEGERRSSAPSVMGFLKRVGGMPRVGHTPAKGMLGEISKEDLIEAGRLGAGPLEPRPELESAATVEAELSEPAGRWEHLEDVVLEDTAAVSRLRLARQVGARANRGDPNARREERIPARLRVEYRRAGKVEVDLAGNISTGGAFVRTANPLQVGDPLLLSFDVPDRRLPLQVAARVKWVTPFGDINNALAGMGVEFVALDDDKRQALQSLVRLSTEVRP